MAIECVAAVINARKAPWTGGTLVVLLAMANYASPDGSNIFPSLERLARQCRMTRRNVQLCIDRLLADKVLVLVEHSASRPGVFNQYRLCMDMVRGFEGCPVCGGTLCDEAGCPEQVKSFHLNRRNLRHGQVKNEAGTGEKSDNAYRKNRYRPVKDLSADAPRAPERRGDPALWASWDARLEPQLVVKLEAFDAEPALEGSAIVISFPKAIAEGPILRHRRDISNALPSRPLFRFAGKDLEEP